VGGGGSRHGRKVTKNRVMRLLCIDGTHESTISLRFPGIIFRFLRLEVSTFVIPFFQNANHEHT
jgi:hypothetical protein